MMLAHQIKQRREQLGLSQSELAQLAEIPQPRLSEYERGAKTEMTLGTAKRLARALGCSIDYLANTWDAEMAKPPGEVAPAQTPLAGPRRRGRPRKVAPLASTTG
jgi:transcriptional regulator with XRE-family HTH domain